MMNRRRFLRAAAAPLVAPAMAAVACRSAAGRETLADGGAPALPSGDAAPAQAGATVGVARDPDAVTSPRRAEAVPGLLRRALGAAAGNDARDALARLFRPEDRIGIKVNTLAGPGMSTSVDVVDALVAALRNAGLGSRGVVVFDRLAAELADAGYPSGAEAERRGYRVVGTDEVGYTRELYFSGRVGSLLSRTLLDVDALISAGVVKDHDLSGVAACVKNLYGLIHNPNRYHADNCDPFLADLLAMPQVRGRLRLCVADGLTAQWHGGPALVRAYTWPLGAILASTDAVAIDAVAADMIEARRREKGMPSLAEARRPPRWLGTAAGRGLGTADPAAIRRVEA